MADTTADQLLVEMDALITTVTAEAARLHRRWRATDLRPDFAPSVDNLAAYVALRHQDVRGLQRALASVGLSSLGRCESRVLPALHSVRAAVAALTGQPWQRPAEAARFFAGEERLAARVQALFGCAERTGNTHTGQRSVALLVTCPSEAANDPRFLHDLARRRVDAIRINCAHDDAAAWDRMIAHARTAAEATGHRMRIFMDLAGPKIRTGVLRHAGKDAHLRPGDRLAVLAPGQSARDLPGGVLHAVECTLAEPVTAATPGHRLFIDDGKIESRIESAADGLLVARVERCEAEGTKLKPEKGMNFPDTDFHIAALTDKDRADLAFVAARADAVEYSFVQSAADIALLQQALAEHRPDDWHRLTLVLKIETARAVRNLPEMLVRAGAQQPVAVMIARGDLAMEIGYGRLAEMQEELLWISEAAQVPVIWATQVLEHLVKKGQPSRGELTDAAMAARADCVMLNKGPYLLEAIDALDHLLGRMEDHVHKKSHQLRRLMSW